MYSLLSWANLFGSHIFCHIFFSANLLKQKVKKVKRKFVICFLVQICKNKKLKKNVFMSKLFNIYIYYYIDYLLLLFIFIIWQVF